MIQKSRDYEKLFLQSQSTSKPSSTPIILAMVLLTAFGVSIFTVLRVLITTPLNERMNMDFLSQTYDPHNDCYIISISVVTPRDLIANNNFTLKIANEFIAQIEDGFVYTHPDVETEIYANLLKLKIESGRKSVEIFYRVKFDKGILERDDDIAIAAYSGWSRFEPTYFNLIEKFRRKIPMASEKYEIVRSESDIEVKYEDEGVNRDESVQNSDESEVLE